MSPSHPLHCHHHTHYTVTITTLSLSDPLHCHRHTHHTLIVAPNTCTVTYITPTTMPPSHPLHCHHHTHYIATITDHYTGTITPTTLPPSHPLHCHHHTHNTAIITPTTDTITLTTLSLSSQTQGICFDRFSMVTSSGSISASKCIELRQIQELSQFTLGSDLGLLLCSTPCSDAVH